MLQKRPFLPISGISRSFADNFGASNEPTPDKNGT